MQSFQPHTFGVIKKYCEVLFLQAVSTTTSKTLLSLTGSIPCKKNKQQYFFSATEYSEGTFCFQCQHIYLIYFVNNSERAFVEFLQSH